MFSLNEITARLGIPPQEAEKALQEMMTKRESFGLSNAGAITHRQPTHAANFEGHWGR